MLDLLDSTLGTNKDAIRTGPTPQEILVTDSAIQTFTSRLPHLKNSGDCGEIPATPGLSPINYRIVTIHTLAHVASLVLHQHGADVSARRRCTTAAQGITAVIGQLSDADYQELFIGLGVRDPSILYSSHTKSGSFPP